MPLKESATQPGDIPFDTSDIDLMPKHQYYFDGDEDSIRESLGTDTPEEIFTDDKGNIIQRKDKMTESYSTVDYLDAQIGDVVLMPTHDKDMVAQIGKKVRVGRLSGVVLDADFKFYYLRVEATHRGRNRYYDDKIISRGRYSGTTVVRSTAEKVLRNHGKNNGTGKYDDFVNRIHDLYGATLLDQDQLEKVIEQEYKKMYESQVPDDILVQFQAETKLKLRYDEKSGNYTECTGRSYKVIRAKIRKYNLAHGTNIYCTDDPKKDTTTVILR